MTDMKLSYRKIYGSWGIRLSRVEAPPNGKFISFWTLIGRQVVDREEAERVFAIYKEERLQEKLIEIQQGKACTLAQLAERFVEARPQLSRDTLRMDALAIRQLIGVAGATKQVRAVTQSDLQRMANAALARGLSAASVAAYFRHIRSALNWAVQMGYRPKLPKFPTLPRRKRLPKSIPASHVELILNWCEKHNRELWRMATFAVFTGCRRQEVLGVSGRDVELYPCPELPVVGKVRIVGKGDAERYVPLLIDALPAIEPLPQVGRVWPRIHKDTLSHWFAAAVRGCGFIDEAGAPRYNFHSLRHTFGVVLVQRGIAIRMLQKILGHSDLRVTEIYSDVADKAVEAELGRVW